MKQRQLDEEKAKVMYGRNVNQLPEISWEEFNKRVSSGEVLIVIEGIVHDVKNFVHEHPGIVFIDYK